MLVVRDLVIYISMDHLLGSSRHILVILLLGQRAICLPLKEVLAQFVCSVCGILTPSIIVKDIRSKMSGCKLCSLAEARGLFINNLPSSGFEVCPLFNLFTHCLLIYSFDVHAGSRHVLV